MSPMTVLPIQTRLFQARENLTRFIVESTPREQTKEKMILVVTSKIVSLAEDRFAPVSGLSKQELVERESDVYLGEIGYGCFLTIKHGLMIASAGIDESNSANGDYILFPEDPFASAQKLWHELREAWDLEELGVLLTDSKTTPLRRGTSGICLSYWGFNAVINMVDTPDLFGRMLKMTRMNMADGLAGAAVMLMGEGRESRPLAVIHNSGVEFTQQTDPSEILIPLEEDLYYPILRQAGEKAVAERPK